MTRYPAAQRQPLPAIDGITTGGQVLVINAWATWCGPCRDESKTLARLAESPSSSSGRVRFVGLDENDTPADSEAFLRQVGVAYPQVPDDGSRLARLSAWLPAALPGTLVIDRDGKVAARVIGAVTPGQLDPVLAEL